MLRGVSIILLILALATQTFNAAFIKLGYIVNPDMFAKNCVNKALPKMHCNGKCQMMKKIKEEEKNEQENLVNKWSSKSQNISSKSFYPYLNLPTSRVLKIKFTYPNIIGLITKHSQDFFHPPQA